MSDPCECSYEALMRRLLSALRDIQNDCTDTECEGPSGTGDGGLSLPLLLTIWGITALVLFLVRPASMRQTARDRQINEKQRINQDDNQPPPGPDVL